MLPKITIITPVYNSVQTIEKAIKSLVNQNYPNLEYLVYDAKSSDGTLDIIKKYDDFITKWVSKKDKGANDIYNKGVKEAKGDLIAFLNADDWYEPGILNEVAQTYQENPDADMFTCGFKLVTKDRVIKEIKGKGLEFNLPNVIKYGPLTNARFVKPKIYKKYGCMNCFNEKGEYLDTADKELFLNLAINQVKNKEIDQIGYVSLMHENSRTFNNNHNIKKKLYREHFDLVERFFKEKDLVQYQKLALKKWYAQEIAKYLLMHILSFDANFFKETKRFKNLLGFFWFPKSIKAAFLFYFK